MAARGEMDCLTENTALGLVNGTLPAAAVADIEQHLDECSSCRRLASAVGWVPSPPAARSAAAGDSISSLDAPTAPTAPLVRGSAVGRYLVVQPLGAGAMSTVYVAYDPELDRRVALKLVRPDVADPAAREEVRARLLLEAQALARLSHPNVIAVHDAGSHHDQVFIAMELVCGRTLGQWLRAGAWSRRQVVALFLQAGAGLAAAHAAGVVHGDFEPANVLVGDDGQVRVVDFGLAHMAAVAEPSSAFEPAAAGAAGDAGDIQTQRGRVSGTPAYVAPEQRDGGPADARSDQFSFCVALHEALYGERPSGAAPGAELAATATATARHVREPTRGWKVPARIRRVVRRGLREAPEDRYPSMAALLADLGRDPVRRWRLPLAVVALASLLATGGVAYRAHLVRERDRCRGLAGQLAGVWDASRRRAVRAAFLASGRPQAAAAFGRVAERLDGQAAAWVTARSAACAGTRRAGPAGELASLQAQCLDWQLEVMRGFTDVLAQADGGVVERASDIADRLSRLDQCAMDARLTRRPRAPTEPTARAGVEVARRHLVKSKVLAYAGRPRAAEREARAAAAAARAVGFRPLEAEALRLTGYALLQLGQLEPAEDALWRAVQVGKSCGHDEPAAEAWADLVWLTGVAGARSRERLALAERYGQQAAAVVERMGGDTFLAGKVFHTLSMVALARGDFRQAEERARAAIGYLGETAAGRLQLPAVQQLLALVLAEQGRLTEAVALHGRALTTVAAAVGRENPRFARYSVEEAAPLAALGRHDEALAAARATLALARRGMPPQQDVAAQALDVAGQSLAALGRHDEALAHHREALAIFSQAVGPEDPRAAGALEHVGTVLRLQGRLAAALTEQQRACALLERTGGPEHPLVGGCLHQLAITLLAQAQPVAARPHLERALTIREQAGARPADVAATRFALAEALWAAGRDRARARSLATQARDGYARAEGDHRARSAVVERWLARPGAR